MTRTIESLDALMARILIDNARKHDVIADTRRMQVLPTEEGGVSLVLDADVGVSEFVLTDHALGQIATDLAIPKRYFDRMKVDAPELFRSNVHHWFYNDPKPRLVRGMLNGTEPMTGRAWMSDRFRRLDNMEIARKLLPEFENLGMPVEFHQAAVTDSKLYIRALFPDLERDVKAVGDTVRWGVSITNSEIGGGSLTISSFVLRLACKNGMVADKVLNARHVGKREDEGILSNEALAADDVAFWLAARDELRALCSEAAFQTVIDRLEGLSEQQVVSPVAATRMLASEFSLSESEEEAVMLEFATGRQVAGGAQWGMLNAVTAVAKTVESFDRQAELEGIGWNIAEMTPSAWEMVALAVR